jgi:surface antigen
MLAIIPGRGTITHRLKKADYMVQRFNQRWNWALGRFKAGRRRLKINYFLLWHWLPQPVRQLKFNRRLKWNTTVAVVLPLAGYLVGSQTDLAITKTVQHKLVAAHTATPVDPAGGIAHTATLPPGNSLPGTPPPEAVAMSAPPVAILASNVSYPNTYTRSQCTWWVAHLRPVPPRWGNAGNWYHAAQLAGWSVGRLPRPGAIAWTSAGRAGHVAYVEAVNGNMITISEMNYFGPGAFNRRYQFGGSTDERTVSASWFGGFIY